MRERVDLDALEDEIRGGSPEDDLTGDYQCDVFVVPRDLLAVIAELRAARKVVEASYRVSMTSGHPVQIGQLRGALAEWESLA